MTPAGGMGRVSRAPPGEITELEAFTERIREGSLDLTVSSALFIKQHIETILSFRVAGVCTGGGAWSVKTDGQEGGPAGFHRRESTVLEANRLRT